MKQDSMSAAKHTPAERLEYLEGVEFPTPAEFAELRSLLAAQTDAHAKATGSAS